MRHRGRTYLEIAADVLRNLGQPLGIEEIVKVATDSGELRSAGRSPESAMRARLSSELRDRAFSSKFQRVGPNRFALREWELPEYVAPPFLKRLPDEIVACVTQEAITGSEARFGVLADVTWCLDLLKKRGALSFHPRRKAEYRNDLRQLVAYAMLRDSSGRILTYRRGQYSSAPAMLRGSRCLGFGGHVLQEDAEGLFGLTDGGVVQAAYREIAEELRGSLPSRLDIAGVIVDDSSQEGVRHLGVVLDGELPRTFGEDQSSRERAVNDLQLLSVADAWKRFHEFEFWSQLVLKSISPGGLSRPTTVVRPHRRTVDAEVVVVVGEIASGKSTFAKLLKEQAGFSVVSSRACVAELLGLADFEGGDRANFQRAAAELVASIGGTRLLADEIAAATRDVSKPSVIDGVRHVDTLRHLRSHFARVVVIFIDTGRDQAFANYRASTTRPVTLAEFREARAHPVEREVADLRHEADAYIFNGGEAEQMLDVFSKWWQTFQTGGPRS